MPHEQQSVESLSARLHFTGDLPWQDALDRAKERHAVAAYEGVRKEDTGGLPVAELQKLIVVGYTVKLFEQTERGNKRKRGHIGGDTITTSKRPRMMEDYENSHHGTDRFRIIDDDDDFPRPQPSDDSSPSLSDAGEEDAEDTKFDRFDIRNVTSTFADAPACMARVPEEVIDAERWKSLPKDDLEDSEERSEEERRGRGAEIAPPAYTESTTATPAPDPEVQTCYLHCPFKVMPVPAGLQAPSSLRMYTIIERSAKATAANPQLALMLKLKNKDDPNFAFLYDDNALHAFYQHLQARARNADADWPTPLLVQQPTRNDDMDKAPPKRAGLVHYSDSGSESDDDSSAIASKHDAPQTKAAADNNPTVTTPQPPPSAINPANVPPDILETIEKLLKYVAKNGVAFVEMIQSREGSNPKFSFLFNWSPYHAYFTARLHSLLNS